jgi:glycosyltransferase involved in cell wall biosynthesis
MDTLRRHPAADVEYVPAGGFHVGADGAPCAVAVETALNRCVRRAAIPDIGFRALRLRARFDLVHVHAHPVRLSGLGSTPLVMSEGSSSAVYLGDYLGWDEKRLDAGYRRARRIYRTLGIADRLLTLERVTKAYVFSNWARDINLRWGADPAKLEVVYPGFPVQPERDRAERAEFTFLFVGGDFERKGGFELVEAFAEVARAHPHARLFLAGTDPAERNPDRDLYAWVGSARRERVLQVLDELERRGAVVRTNWIDRTRLLREVFPQADAFVMPSRAEGFGFTNVEAMSFGLPVITSTAGPGAEVVADGQHGLLVAPGDVDELRAAMLSLVDDRELAARLGAGARQNFLGRFTLAHFVDRIGDLYRRAVEGQ